MIPAQWRVLVTRRRKYICRRCSGPRRAGARTGARRARRAADRSGHRARDRLQRFTISPRSMRAGDPTYGRHWATGPAAPASIFSPSRNTCAAWRGRSSVHGRNHGTGARSPAWPNQKRLLLGDRLLWRRDTYCRARRQTDRLKSRQEEPIPPCRPRSCLRTRWRPLLRAGRFGSAPAPRSSRAA